MRIQTVWVLVLASVSTANASERGASSVKEVTDPGRAAKIVEIEASKGTLFAKESTAVTFSATLKAPLPANASLSLVELSPEGGVARYIGTMNDQGAAGDFRANDQIYSRKIHIKEKSGGMLEYAALLETEEGLIRSLKEPKVAVRILARPTFLQAMSNVWQKVKAALNGSAS